VVNGLAAPLMLGAVTRAASFAGEGDTNGRSIYFDASGRPA